MADKLADKICGCANREQHRRDVADLLAYSDAAFLQGRREALEEAARVADRHDTGDCTREDMEARRIAAEIRKLGEA